MTKLDGLACHRVLVVEDEAMIAMLVGRILTEAGFQVVGPAPSVTEGLAAIEQGGIDAALLDVRLGNEEVYPAADALRARSVPFIFLSGYGAESLPDGYACHPCLRKPFRAAALLAALTGLLAVPAP